MSRDPDDAYDDKFDVPETVDAFFEDFDKLTSDAVINRDELVDMLVRWHANATAIDEQLSTREILDALVSRYVRSYADTRRGAA